MITLADLRRYAVVRSLFTPTTLARAIARLGFVQADPIRAPARAQDLTLRHRVIDYRAGDLEQRYPQLAVEEDFFINYGFLSAGHHALMHPRTMPKMLSKARQAKALAVLEFVRERGAVHPREVDAHFAHGKVRNWFGGSSNASTQLLDALHYRGLLRVARREGGTRVYAARGAWAPHGDDQQAQVRMDALVNLVVAKYAPLPATSLAQLVSRLGAAAPQWSADRKRALAAAKQRLASANVDGVDWYWPADENPGSRKHAVQDSARLLTPFDPIVWDRRRFEMFWGWAYRFEAYTPAPKRNLGYYALPLLWREQVVGWANVTVQRGTLRPEVGFVGPRIAEPAFAMAMDEELHRLHQFLGLDRESDRELGSLSAAEAAAPAHAGDAANAATACAVATAARV